VPCLLVVCCFALNLQSSPQILSQFHLIERSLYQRHEFQDESSMVDAIYNVCTMEHIFLSYSGWAVLNYNQDLKKGIEQVLASISLSSGNHLNN
jgi:hypothetical protein